MISVIATDDFSTAAPAPKLENGATGWELALVTAPSSNEPATTTTKLVFAHLQICLFRFRCFAVKESNDPLYTSSY